MKDWFGMGFVNMAIENVMKMGEMSDIQKAAWNSRMRQELTAKHSEITHLRSNVIHRPPKEESWGIGPIEIKPHAGSKGDVMPAPRID